MKKARIAAAILAAVMSVTFVPQIAESVSVTAYAEDKLDAPADFKADTVTKTAIKLVWTGVPGADAYRVFMYDNETDEYEEYKNVISNKCTVSGLTSGTTYKFKVAALVEDNGKFTVQTKSPKLIVQTTQKLAAPQNVKASTTNTAIKITWDAVAGADAYRVFKYNKSTASYDVYKNVSGTSCTVKDLSPNTSYSFKLAALVKVNGKYQVQTVTGKLTAATKAKAASRSSDNALKEFELPQFGQNSSTVLKNCGISNYSKSYTSSGNTQYVGYAMYLNTKSTIFLEFDKSDKLISFAVFTPMSSAGFATVVNKMNDTLGFDYDFSFNSDYNPIYSWSYSGVVLTMEYLYDSSQMIMLCQKA